MNQNFCVVKSNTFYQELYDKLLEEDLNMVKNEHTLEIKRIIENKILQSDKVIIHHHDTSMSEPFINVVLESIINDFDNQNLQGDTLLSFCDDNHMYEMMIIQDLSSTDLSGIDLNEFASLLNIELLPVYWDIAMIKTSYADGEPKGSVITKQDIADLFINLFYHTGIMTDTNGKMIEIEFTGDSPYNVIGINFSQENSIDLIGFTLLPFVEKNTNANTNTKLNVLASKIMGCEIYTRVYFILLCPTTNKKYFNLSCGTMRNILNVIDNQEIRDNIEKDSLNNEFMKNPFLLLKKYLCSN